MQLKRTHSFLVLGLACFMGFGCSDKSDESLSTSPVEPTTPASTPASPPAGSGEASLVDTPTPEVAAVAQKAQEAAAASVEKAQVLIDQGRALLAEKKYGPAVDKLKELGTTQLSEDQKALMTELNTELTQMGEQITQALDQLKTVIRDKDYTKASELVSQLSEFELTPQQTELLEQLKTQLEKALGENVTEEGAKALKGLLPGN